MVHREKGEERATPKTKRERKPAARFPPTRAVPRRAKIRGTAHAGRFSPKTTPRPAALVP
jgi:hypothetical protein